MEHLTKALSQIGIKEIKGQRDNPEILKYFNATGFNGTKLKDETAWCSAFMNWVCHNSGLEYPNKLNARSWLKVGWEVKKPKIGDVVVFWREDPQSWKGHVGIFIRETRNYIYCLGGNQNNQVNIKAYPKSKLLQYRRLC